MRIKSIFIALVLTFGLAACSSEVSRQEVVDTLSEDGSFTEEQAGCIYDELEAAYSAEDLQTILQADSDEDVAAGGIDVEQASADITAAVFACM